MPKIYVYNIVTMGVLTLLTQTLVSYMAGSANIIDYVKDNPSMFTGIGFKILSYMVSTWYIMISFGTNFLGMVKGFLLTAAFNLDILSVIGLNPVSLGVNMFFAQLPILPLLKRNIYEFTGFALPFIYIGLFDLSEETQIDLTYPVMGGLAIAALEKFVNWKGHKGVINLSLDLLLGTIEWARVKMFEGYDNWFARQEENYGKFEFIHSIVDEDVFAKVMIDNYATRVINNVKGKVINVIMARSKYEMARSKNEFLYAKQSIEVDELKKYKKFIDNQLSKDKNIQDIIEKNKIIDIISSHSSESDIIEKLTTILEQDEYNIITEYQKDPNRFLFNNKIRKTKIEYYDSISFRLDEDLSNINDDTIIYEELDAPWTIDQTIFNELGQTLFWWNTDRNVHSVETIKQLIMDYKNLYISQYDSYIEDVNNIPHGFDQLLNEYEEINILIEKDFKILNIPMKPLGGIERLYPNNQKVKADFYNTLESNNILENPLELIEKVDVTSSAEQYYSFNVSERADLPWQIFLYIVLDLFNNETTVDLHSLETQVNSPGLLFCMNKAGIVNKMQEISDNILEVVYKNDAGIITISGLDKLDKNKILEEYFPYFLEFLRKSTATSKILPLITDTKRSCLTFFFQETLKVLFSLI